MTNRKVKIIATLGPASNNSQTIQSLIKAGVNVFRVNMSHGEHDQHKKSIDLIREAEKKLDQPIAILADLQGPKLRIARFKEAQIFLEKGQEFVLDLEPKLGNSNRVTFPHPEIFPHILSGMTILLNDGNIRLKVTLANHSEIQTEVLEGGTLSDNKGVNLPDTELPIPALTKKDKKDIDFLMETSVDYVGLSFVQRPEDVLDLKRILAGKKAVLSKIEKPQAIGNLEEIIDLSDGIMVARGDLGVEMSPEKVPPIQKKIIRLSKKKGKPVVVATQMLESMIERSTPTRAEATDVATAVYDGADAVMLSAESAVGKYPVESVEMMAKIISAVEKDGQYIDNLKQLAEKADHDVSDSITGAARQLSETLEAAAIVTYTATGLTALRVSHKKPQAPILAMTNKIETSRKLCLAWGVIPSLVHDLKSLDEMIQKAIERSKESGLVKNGDKIIITCGIPFGNPGTTNVINVELIK